MASPTVASGSPPVDPFPLSPFVPLFPLVPVLFLSSRRPFTSSFFFSFSSSWDWSPPLSWAVWSLGSPPTHPAEAVMTRASEIAVHFLPG